MDKLLKKYTKRQIAKICNRSEKTVQKWFKDLTMPYWAFKKLGYEPFTRNQIQELYHKGYKKGIENKPILDKFEEWCNDEENQPAD